MLRSAILSLAAAVFLPGTTWGQAATRPAATTQPAAVAPVAAAQPDGGARRRALGFDNTQRDDQRKVFLEAADGGVTRIGDLIRFRLVEGRLESEWIGKSTNRQPRRMRMEGSDAAWLVNHFVTTTGAFYSVNRYLFDGAEDDFWMVMFSTQEGLGSTTLMAQGGESSALVSLAYQQAPTGVTLMLVERGLNKRRMLSASDLEDLRRKHPDESCRYLLPLLREMTGQPILRPGAGDVYRVFTHIPADPNVTRQIDAILPGLAAADPAERDRATAALNALGRPGALAAMRYDEDRLLPEQRARLQALALRHATLGEEPAKAAADVNFLVECLEDEDPGVRAGAKELLERVAGRKLDFDPAAAPERRAAAAAAIRTLLTQTAAERKEPETPQAK